MDASLRGCSHVLFDSHPLQLQHSASSIRILDGEKKQKKIHRDAKETKKNNSHIHHSQYDFVNDMPVLPLQVRSEITKLCGLRGLFSSLTFDSSLDNFFENASVIEQPLGHETYGVHGPGFEPINYMETLRSVYSL